MSRAFYKKDRISPDAGQKIKNVKKYCSLRGKYAIIYLIYYKEWFGHKNGTG